MICVTEETREKLRDMSKVDKRNIKDFVEIIVDRYYKEVIKENK